MDFRCNLVKSIELSLFGPTNLLIDDIYIFSHLFTPIYNIINSYSIIHNLNSLRIYVIPYYTMNYSMI